MSRPGGAYLIVEHLISCDDVQLHTEKVIPEKREIEKVAASEGRPDTAQASVVQLEYRCQLWAVQVTADFLLDEIQAHT